MYRYTWGAKGWKLQMMGQSMNETAVIGYYDINYK